VYIPARGWFLKNGVDARGFNSLYLWLGRVNCGSQNGASTVSWFDSDRPANQIGVDSY
jgi:hypothetical protein